MSDLGALTRWPHWPKVKAIVAILLAAVVADRLTHLPTAQPIVASDRAWPVGIGEELLLTPPATPGPLLALQSGAGDGLHLEAGPVRLADGTDVRLLQWRVSKFGAEASNDNKVTVEIATAAADGKGEIVLQRSGQKIRPELLMGSTELPLEVAAGIVIGDLRVLPPVTLIHDGRQVEPDGFGLRFTLLPGGEMSLLFPTLNPDGKPAGLTTSVGAFERRGPRLYLRALGIRGEDAAKPWKSACAAEAGTNLWPALFRWSSTPTGADCLARPGLAVTALEIDKSQLSVDLTGTAYVTNIREPAPARWWTWLLGNPVLAVVTGAILTGIGGWAVRVLSGKA